MKNVLLVGNFGSRNVGDEIILWTALKKYPEAIVMSADENFSRRFLQINSPLTKGVGGIFSEKLNPTFIPPFPTGVRSLIKFIFSGKSREIYKNLKIEKIIFPGGGLLAIKMKAYIIWGITVWWLKKYYPKAEMIFEHQGVDKISCPLKKLIIKYIFKNSSKISVRDEISRNFLQTLNIKSENTGDCVEMFLKKSNLNPSPRKNLVLINACRENSAKFSELCTKDLVPQGTACVFICFDPQDARYVPEKFRGKIIFPENIEEAFKLFQQTKIAIGQRLHFLILANHFCGKNNTFTLGEPYSQKVVNFAKKYGIAEMKVAILKKI